MRFYWWMVLGALSASTVTGCYTQRELRQLADEQPDPRQQEADRLWGAILKVVHDKAWPVDVQRREDLTLRTRWVDVEEGLRKQVRFMVVVAPMGVGINVKISHARHQGEVPEGQDPWKEVEGDAALDDSARAEENELARRIYTLWQQNR